MASMSYPHEKRTERLVAARAVFDTAGVLSKKFYGEDMNGNDVPPESPDAVKWCAIGAIRKFPRDRHTEDAEILLGESAIKLFKRHCSDVSRTLDQAAVLRMYDHAIADTWKV